MTDTVGKGSLRRLRRETGKVRVILDSRGVNDLEDLIDLAEQAQVLIFGSLNDSREQDWLRRFAEMNG